MPLEFTGTRTLTIDGADCRVCLQMRWPEREAYAARVVADPRTLRVPGMVDYHMPVGTDVVSLRDWNYAHANHSKAEVDAYDSFLRDRGII